MSACREAFQGPVWKEKGVFPHRGLGNGTGSSPSPSLPIGWMVMDVELPQVQNH